MIAGKNVLAVVPARGGSKGIALKNLRRVAGVPMVARVGECVKQVIEIDRAVVSTDHEEIAAVAEAAGLKAPFRRPEDISGDRIGDINVLRHALAEMERIDAKTYDIVVMLQPTSPLRRPEHIASALEMLVEGEWDAVWTVSETDSKAHPLKQLTVTDGSLDHWDERGGGIIARQQLEPVYHRNGIAYAMTRQCLVEQKTILGARSGALILDGNFVSIDTGWDIDLVEFILASQAADGKGSR
jgi:CMP-N,N'-diacetyllegionaminic acid synthase